MLKGSIPAEERVEGEEEFDNIPDNEKDGHCDDDGIVIWDCVTFNYSDFLVQLSQSWDPKGPSYILTIILYNLHLEFLLHYSN